MSNIKVIYRISDNGYNKPKFSNATKWNCLQNAIKEFGVNSIHLFLDETNLLPDTLALINDVHRDTPFASYKLYAGGSSAGSFRHVFNYALTTFQDNDVIFFSEDDYLYLPGVAGVIEEGLARADYVTPYLHGDRFIPASHGGNQFVDDAGSFVTRLCKTNTCFWAQVESTTMTFATTVAQLKQDEDIWRKYTTGTHPNDFGLFLELGSNQRSLVAPIPTYATHAEPAWQSPLIGTGISRWEDV